MPKSALFHGTLSLLLTLGNAHLKSQYPASFRTLRREIQARLARIPCIYPEDQGKLAETSSHQTCCTANFSYLTEIYQSNFGVAAGTPAFCGLSQAMIGYSEPENSARERFGGLWPGYLFGPKNRFRFAAL